MAGTGSTREPYPPTLAAIATAWWPLALSWLLMAVELPTVAAVVARLPDPEIHLAASGSYVHPIALVIEAPIIMLLSASTALSRDRAGYQALRRFTHRSGAALTLLHLLIVLTPLYDLIVGGWMGAPEPVLEPARMGLLLMTPWTWAIASRRFNQGVLIRFGHGRAVTQGTVVRLLSNVTVLAGGWAIGTIPGATLAGAAIATGVVAEAMFASARVRPVVVEHLQHDDPAHPPLRGRAFVGFYLPLAFTSFVALVAHALGSASIARMPDELPSLAVWPVVHGLIFLFQVLGLAFSEVVVAQLDRPGAKPVLLRFALVASGSAAVVLVVLAATPLAELWFDRVSGLRPGLVELAGLALWFGVPIPVLRVLQSWFESVLVHARRTRAVGEAVVVFVLVAGAVLGTGIWLGRWPGIHVALLGFSLGRAAQTGWLWARSRPVVAALDR